MSSKLYKQPDDGYNIFLFLVSIQTFAFGCSSNDKNKPHIITQYTIGNIDNIGNMKIFKMSGQK